MITNSIVSSSSGWDEGSDYGDIQLYDAVLAIDTKKFKKGDVVDTVTFMFSCGVCQIWEKVGEKPDNGYQQLEIVEEFPIRLIAEIP